MIPVHRGAEPPQLTDVREEQLPKAIQAFNAHGPGSKELVALLGGYDVVKRDLYLRQHRKCAYCERTPGFVGQPVEHFRPKKHAVRRSSGKRETDRERYWWLTWTWEKLVRELVQPMSPLTAATWSMLDVLRNSTSALRHAKLPAPPLMPCAP